MNARWSEQTKLIVTIGMLLGLIWAAFRFGQALAPFIVALVISYLINQAVGWIVHYTGWPRTPVVVVHYLLILAILITAPAVFTPRLIRSIQVLFQDLQNAVVELSQRAQEPVVLFGFQLDVPSYSSQILQRLPSVLQPMATNAVNVVINIANALIQLVFVLVVSFYIVKDTPHIGRFAFQRIPAALRPEMRALYRELSAIWDAYLRGEVVLGFIIGVMVTVVMTIIGLPNAPLLGLISGILEVVPGIGPAIAMIPGVLIALVQGSTWLPLTHEWFALLTAACYLAIQQLEGNLIVPRVIGDRVNLHPVVILVGALAGAQLAGMLGVILAAPVIGSLRILFGYAYSKILDLEPFKQPVLVPTPGQQQIGGRTVRAILFDLDGTLAETDDAIIERWAKRLRPLRRIFPGLNPARAARRLIRLLNAPASYALMLLDRLGWDDETFRVYGWLQRLRGAQSLAGLQPVVGTPQLVSALSTRYRLGIITTRSSQEARSFLEERGFARVFSVIIGHDNSPRLKPHPLPVRKAAEALRVPTSECVLVGDTSADVRAAKAAGAIAIGVLCGFGNAKDLSEADLVLPTTAQLAEWL